MLQRPRRLRSMPTVARTAEMSAPDPARARRRAAAPAPPQGPRHLSQARLRTRGRRTATGRAWTAARRGMRALRRDARRHAMGMYVAPDALRRMQACYGHVRCGRTANPCIAAHGGAWVQKSSGGGIKGTCQRRQQQTADRRGSPSCMRMQLRCPGGLPT